MQNVIAAIKKKEQQFEAMKAQMNKSINYNHIQSMQNQGREIANENYRIINGDCVQEISRIDSNSVGFSIFSPPFAELYTYSNHQEDMGNSANYDQFVQHFSYLVGELQRVMMSGRNVAVHCMDIPAQKWKDGHIGLKDFSGMIIRAFEANGFVYHSRVTLWKNPVVEMQRTKALGLLHKQIKKNSAMSRVGIPDYLLVFRKDGEVQNPVQCNIPVDLWQKWASPVWMDIDYTKTLNGIQARHENDEKHICPLQLDTIERAIQLWSNEGDTVLTPFMGIGSEVYKAVELNRYGIGIELKESYFDVAAKNAEKAVSMKRQEELFLV
jgi:DNA modification methylase